LITADDLGGSRTAQITPTAINADNFYECPTETAARRADFRSRIDICVLVAHPILNNIARKFAVFITRYVCQAYEIIIISLISTQMLNEAQYDN